MSNEKKPTNKYLHVEYMAANDAYMHYDNYTWQVGAILIAGAFVFWGFLLNKNVNPYSSAIGSLLVAVLMSIWFLYSSHNRQIYLCKLHRLREIETKLGLKQHLRWKLPKENPESYKVFGPKGHHLDFLVYGVASLGAPIIGIFSNRYLGLHLLTFIATVFTIIIVALYTNVNGRALLDHLNEIPKEDAW